MSANAKFKRGDRVIVRLTEDHQLGGDHPHAGEFVAYHLFAPDWAIVNLDEEHAGGSESRPPTILDVPVEAIEPAGQEESTEDSSAT